MIRIESCSSTLDIASPSRRTVYMFSIVASRKFSVTNFLTTWIFGLVFLSGLKFGACSIFPTSLSNVFYVQVDNSAESGAVCLDGSPPAYYISTGFGNGTANWLVYFEGGAWCSSDAECAQRATGYLGSTKNYTKDVAGLFTAILSNKSEVNPDFYNWNVVYGRYCDGASFMGNREDPVVIPETDSTNGKLVNRTIYYRGARVWNSIMEDLLTNWGMNNANKALLSGCSAGGLTAIFHCDHFAEIFPSNVTVKCVPDSGFFLDLVNIFGGHTSQHLFISTANTHNVTGALNKNCVASLKYPLDCFFAQYVLPYINTPIYILESSYDYWQVDELLIPAILDPNHTWTNCKGDLSKCNHAQIDVLQGFRKDMLAALAPLQASKDGDFLISCPGHCIAKKNFIWNGHIQFLINNKTMAQSIGDWYFGRNQYPHLTIDSPYPTNPTCSN